MLPSSRKKKRDARLDVRARGNLILTKMEELGIVSIAALTRETGLSYQALHRLITKKDLPIGKKMRWKPSAIILADFFQCLPEDIFSDEKQRRRLAVTRTSVEASFAERQQNHLSYRAALPEELVFISERQRCIKSVLSRLPSREQEVISSRFGIDGDEMTLEEVAHKLGCSRERARQIEERALSTLRRPCYSVLLKEL